MVHRHPVIEQDLDLLLAMDLPWDSLHGKRILVTGAAGFIGGCIIDLLARINELKPGAGLRIYALVRDVERLQQRLPWHTLRDVLKPVVQDVAKPLAEDASFDFIVHAASPASPAAYLARPVDAVRANALGTLNLLETARRTSGRLLLLSSGTVYGAGNQPCEEIGETDFGALDPLDPRASYSESKRLAETACAAHHAQYGTDALIARISHTYGPGMALDDGRAISYLLGQVLAGRDPVLTSDGLDCRPFCYITDLLNGLMHILLKGQGGEAYNVGSTTETEIFNLGRLLIALSSRPELTVRTRLEVNSPPPHRSSGHFAIDKLKRLGWAPTVSLDEGLRRLLAYHGIDGRTEASRR